MTMHEEWTDKLSDYLDDELSNEDRDAVGAHLRDCARCTEVFNDLKRVVARAQAAGNASRPPQADLWADIAGRLEGHAARPPAQVMPFAPRQPWRVAFTLPQLAAAALVIAAVSGGLGARLMAPSTALRAPAGMTFAAPEPPPPPPAPEPGDARIATVGLADAQYDAAVVDLEKALKAGRGRLDASTIAIVERNLQIIDQAIAQAREALVTDPANSYLSSHLVEARRHKLDLLRRAAALTNDTN